ncbi:TM2 domain-containing protein [Rivularia sp. PCC 7116]|uniref:TM2 domain-containing protein n=1 Tax=Rivularia sp. PCC 7116 TaxID=373994 RepID=UPI00029F1E77|nr:TM2 domain-containing protein [Rivularia sp. PCC 7116]AFY59163.1 TM2 domain-containing protein [Rivularia sp. PCC 7116]
MKSKGLAYILWLLSVFSIFGAQRFYCKRYISGFIYLFTFGCFGIGQIIDLFTIPNMVDEENLKYQALYGYQNLNNNGNPQVTINVDGRKSHASKTTNNRKVSDTIQILQTAKNNGGMINLSDCVLATGKETAQVKQTLDQMCKDGLIEITNLPDSGAIVYKLL